MKFQSNQILLRPTTMGDAFVRAFGGTAPQLVRETRMEGLLRARHDKDNVLPSVRVPLQFVAEKRPA